MGSNDNWHNNWPNLNMQKALLAIDALPHIIIIINTDKMASITATLNDM